QKQGIEQSQEKLREQIREQIGEEDVSMKIANASLSYYTPKPTSRFDSKKFKTEHLDIDEQYVKMGAPGARRFCITYEKEEDYMSNQIYADIAKVMRSVDHVGKGDFNSHQKFNFRGIDGVLNAVGPALREHNVVVYPRLHDVAYEEVKTSGGKAST